MIVMILSYLIHPHFNSTPLSYHTTRQSSHIPSFIRYVVINHINHVIIKHQSIDGDDETLSLDQQGTPSPSPSLPSPPPSYVPCTPLPPPPPHTHTYTPPPPHTHSPSSPSLQFRNPALAGLFTQRGKDYSGRLTSKGNTPFQCTL